MSKPPPLLWIDCIGAFITGALMLALTQWLSALYAAPSTWIIAHAAVHIGYGAFSCSLAVRTRRPRALIHTLITANAAWAVVCFCAAFALSRTVSPWSLTHLSAEGFYLCALAALEWRWRAALLTEK